MLQEKDQTGYWHNTHLSIQLGTLLLILHRFVLKKEKHFKITVSIISWCNA